jgi:predicted nucleic acid-binding protein
VVIDASLAVKLLTEEPYTEEAIALANSWADLGVQLAAPYFMLAEVANALLKKILRRELPAHEARPLLNQLSETGIEFQQPMPMHTRALELAQQLGQ